MERGGGFVRARRSQVPLLGPGGLGGDTAALSSVPTQA
jgi:hypothetical protein